MKDEQYEQSAAGGWQYWANPEARVISAKGKSVTEETLNARLQNTQGTTSKSQSMVRLDGSVPNNSWQEHEFGNRAELGLNPGSARYQRMTLEILLYVSEFLMCKMVVITHVSGEGNGNPLQCSCLENPVDGGAWQAAIQGVART